jgi:hypothetical protein
LAERPFLGSGDNGIHRSAEHSACAEVLPIRFVHDIPAFADVPGRLGTILAPVSPWRSRNAAIRVGTAVDERRTVRVNHTHSTSIATVAFVRGLRFDQDQPCSAPSVALAATESSAMFSSACGCDERMTDSLNDEPSCFASRQS